MAFPFTALPITVELQLNSVWTDISTYVYERDEIRIDRGRRDYGQNVDPGRCSLTLDNHDGRFSPRNPTGAYYGSIGRNTPIRVSVDAGDSYLKMTGAANDRASTPDHASLDITGDIDIRFDGTLDDWTNAAQTEIAAKYSTTGDNRSWFVLVDSTGQPSFSWSPDGTLASRVTATATEPLPIFPTGRVALRVVMDVNVAGTIHTVTFYYAETLDEDNWIELGEESIFGGTTSIFSGTGTLEVGDIGNVAAFVPSGKIHRFQLRNGIDGTIVANPDFTIQTPGATSFADSAGRTWTVGGSATISNRKIRFLGEVSSWPVQWTNGASSTRGDVFVQIEASGILRRLNTGNSPLDSTLRRRIPFYSPLAYWPMEDGQNATQAASPISGVRPMKAARLDFASNDTLPASKSLPTIASVDGALTELTGRVPAPTSTQTTWMVTWVYRNDVTSATLFTYMRILTTGAVAEWYVQIDEDTLRILTKDSDGTILQTSDTAIDDADFYRQWVRAELDVTQDGPVTIDWRFTLYDIGGAPLQVTNTFAGSIGNVIGVGGPPGGFAAALDGMSIGHISVWNDRTVGNTAYENAIDAWAGEFARERMERLSTEEDIPLVAYGVQEEQERIGAQGPSTFPGLLQGSADADQGILYESRDKNGLAYRGRATLYDQTVALSLNYAGSDGLVLPLDPIDDDQFVRNDVEVVRSSGSSTRTELTTGTLSVNAPPNGVGRYPDSHELDLHTDARTAQLAGWLLHLGTWDETRYPVVRMLLQNATAKIEDASTVDVGDRIQITNPPAWLPPDTIDLQVQGYREVIHQFKWELEFNCVPARPFTTVHAAAAAAADDEDIVRADTAGSTLASGVTTTATSWSVATATGNKLWSTAAADVPFSAVVGGERVTVTAISGAASPQTFTVTRSVNGVVKSHLAGADVRLFIPPTIAL